MADFDRLISTIQDSVNEFQQGIPAIQKQILNSVLNDLRRLDVRGGNIVISAKNITLIGQIRQKLLSVVLTDDYTESVKLYTKAFSEVNRLQNSYFRSVEEGFTPPDFAKALQTQSVSTVVEDLTERGIAANVVAGIERILNTSITAGGSYAELAQQLTDHLTTNEKGDGALEKYTKQLTYDALNQSSAQYTQLVSSDLGLDWFVYSGSNLTTTREFCIACVKKKYIHRSEFQDLLDGNFPEFRAEGGTMYKGLPAGMYAQTTVENFPVLRGGYQCGHMLRPVSAASVPDDVRAMIEGA